MPIDLDAYVDGVLAADRTWLGRAITLVESTRPDHADAARELLERLSPKRVDAHRVGITGVPGSGKSTFIDALGSRLTGAGHRVAVLAVDPSSLRTGGSILGDKTRMARLSIDDAAFVRPSPSSGVLGGVAKATREAVVVVEAAGFDVVLVETVGTGQSETAVANMVDTFVLLTLARSGDSLQGIKKGVLELADVIAVNKADGTHVGEARGAARELATALRLVAGVQTDAWVPPVLTCSAQEGSGLDEVWQAIVGHRSQLERDGLLEAKRRAQAVRWMWAVVEDRLLGAFRARPGVEALAGDLEGDLADGTTTPTVAALRLLAAGEGDRAPAEEREPRPGSDV